MLLTDDAGWCAVRVVVNSDTCDWACDRASACKPHITYGPRIHIGYVPMHVLGRLQLVSCINQKY
jgi:hypothetical protein